MRLRYWGLVEVAGVLPADAVCAPWPDAEPPYPLPVRIAVPLLLSAALWEILFRVWP